MKTERCVWIVLLLGAAIWGSMRGGKPDEAAPEAAGNPRLSRESGPRHGAERRRDYRGGRSAKRESGAVGSMDSRMKRALLRTDPLERLAGWLDVLSACDEESIVRVMELWEDRKATGVALPAEEALLNFRLGQLKGADALAGHTGTAADFEKMDSLKKHFEGWLETEPDRAGRWVEDLPPGKFRDQMTLSVIASSARDDPHAASRYAAALPEHLRRKAGEAVGARIRETGSIEDGSALLGNLAGEAGDGSYLNGIFETLISGSEANSDATATRLVETHLDQPYVSAGALAKVSAAKGKADPLAALEWAVEIEQKKTGVRQGSLLIAAVQEMNLEDLAMAEQWAGARMEGPGTADMLASLEARRRILEDRGDDANEYDKDE